MESVYAIGKEAAQTHPDLQLLHHLGIPTKSIFFLLPSLPRGKRERRERIKVLWDKS